MTSKSPVAKSLSPPTNSASLNTPPVSTSSGSFLQMDENSRNALFYCSLLALQFGLQPMIANKFTGQGVSKTSVVIATEIFKILVAVFSVGTGSSAEWEKIKETWSITDSLKVAALPAALYAVQNVCVQYGYVLLDSMTFNLLNQTKTLSAAVWLYLLLNQKQSPIQMVALFLLLISAVLLNLGQTTSPSGGASNYQLGVIVVASASLISGLSAALTQRALVGNKSVRSPIFLSAELAVYGIVVLVINLFLNNELQSTSGSLLANWSLSTLIPVITNGLGGIIVGQVTKYAGGVVKGFALIAGIAITGVAQFLVDGKPLGLKDLAAIVLVSLAIYLHAKFPVPKSPPKPASTSDKPKEEDKKQK